MEPTSLLTGTEVAELLRIKPNTVADWRKRGYGPTPIKVGAFYRYRRSDVLAWLDAQVSA